MRIGSTEMSPEVSPATLDLADELARISALDIDGVRACWRQTFRRAPPRSLGRDMLARILAYRLQEQQLGGLAPAHRKLLEQATRGRIQGARRLKVGTVLVREYQGVLHEVSIVPGGFHWRGTTYASLSTIAKAITGTAWSGPRFFGVRGVVGVRGPA